MMRLAGFVLLGLVLTTGVLAAGQDDRLPDSIPVSDEYVLRTWGVEDGLPSNYVSGITQTPDGYLWLATQGGLTRFDGVRFTPFLKDFAPALTSNRVSAVFAARDGVLWVGFDQGGMARMVGDHFDSILSMDPAGDPINRVGSFAEDATGATWGGVVSQQKAFRWHQGQLTAFSEKDGIGWEGQTAVYSDREGRIWITTVHDCGIFEQGHFRPVDVNGGIWPRLGVDRAGGMWASRDGMLLHYEADGSHRVVAEIGVMTVQAVFEDSHGDVWIGTNDQGLLRYRKDATGHSSLVRVPISNTSVSSIIEDREGDLWVGTAGGGVNRLHAARFALHQKPQGLSSNYTISLAQDSEGRLWLAGRDGVPLRSTDAGNRSFATPAGWSGPPVMAMGPDPQAGVWLATLYGLVRWQDGVFVAEPLTDSLTALLFDHEGTLWISEIEGGLLAWKDHRAERIPAGNGLTKPRALAEDGAGRLWVGTEAGLVFQRVQGRFEPVPLPGIEPGDQIRFIVAEGRDTVWIGALEGGLYRWQSGQVTRLSHQAGLPVEDLCSMVIGADGDFWFGTGHGMYCVARSDLEAAMDGLQLPLRIVTLGRNEGLPGVGFIYGFKNTALRTRDGHLWFATTQGALEILPKPAQVVSPPCSVIIEGASVGGQPVAVFNRRELTLSPGSGAVKLDYTLPELSSPEQVHFRYRLVGWEEDWISAEQQREAIFPRLLPGHYRFEVAASVAGESWSPGVASLAITVPAAWWQTGWFKIGAGVLGAVLLAGAVRFMVRRRLQRQMRRLEQEHLLERERTRIARDMHDEVGANLTRISIASQLARLEPDAAGAGHLEEIAALARRTVESLDELVLVGQPPARYAGRPSRLPRPVCRGFPCRRRSGLRAGFPGDRAGPGPRSEDAPPPLSRSQGGADQCRAPCWRALGPPAGELRAGPAASHRGRRWSGLRVG
ncbi:MAG: two-component regulator propeller domain-containing protein [Chthoniobacteraceae bacterium]